MKAQWIAALGIGVLATVAQAKVESLPTLVTCQQLNEGTWIEAGVLETQNGLQLLVVEHDPSGNTKQIAKQTVRSIARVNTVAYLGENYSIGLVTRAEGGRFIGTLSVIDGVKNPISLRGLACREKSEVRIQN